jgi:hypothetical protein
VTGVAGAATSIKTGDPVTVDGYLGIVIIGKTRLEKKKGPDEINRNA